jgi:hypothetical protein
MTNHANLDGAEEILDLFGAIGCEAVAGIESTSLRVVAKDPEKRSSISDRCIDEPLPHPSTPVSPTNIDRVQLKVDVETRLARWTGNSKTENVIIFRCQDHPAVRSQQASPDTPRPIKITRDLSQPVTVKQFRVGLLPAAHVATSGRLNISQSRRTQKYLVRARAHGSKMILPK